MCHNVIEAMAVGTIPILAYPDWFDPELEHCKNAIIYSDKEDLVNKIKIAIKMPQEEILKLRKGVLEYYNHFLSKGCLGSKYEKNSQAISTLMLFPRLKTGPKEETEGKIFVKDFNRVINGDKF
jgi:hypothetical protein